MSKNEKVARVGIRLSIEERDLLERKAAEMHLSLSSYIRYKLLTSIDDDEKEQKAARD